MVLYKCYISEQMSIHRCTLYFDRTGTVPSYSNASHRLNGHIPLLASPLYESKPWWVCSREGVISQLPPLASVKMLAFHCVDMSASTERRRFWNLCIHSMTGGFAR